MNASCVLMIRSLFFYFVCASPRYFLSGGISPANAPGKVVKGANKATDTVQSRDQAAKAADAKRAAEAEARKQALAKKQQAAAEAGEKYRLAEERKTQEAAEKKRQLEARALQAAKKQEAQTAVSKAKRGSTISLFGLGQGSAESSGATPDASSPKQKQLNVSAPKGVPTILGWKLNRDGSITGRISGSPNFKQGELITTSQIVRGRIERGSVVQTGSGSSYFLG